VVVEGTIAITDHGWYEFLAAQPGLDEVNFWTPSAHWAFHAEPGSPFFFKLKASYRHAVCGFAHFASFSRLPDYLAWEWFGSKNGCPSLEAMRDRIHGIRDRIAYHSDRASNEIGCILLVQPSFFQPEDWVRGPSDWPPANLRHKKYALELGEGRRIWQECLGRTAETALDAEPIPLLVHEGAPRYGAPQIVQPRLGQGTFRVAVTEAYSRACAVTGEHSLPALEASHIKPFAQSGPHAVRNGILLRADLHRLFDQGYLTITRDHAVEVSQRLRLDYDNGRTYFPLHGRAITLPTSLLDSPATEFLQWHNDNVFRAA
jgi:putative restriction endonuclease